ncbi:MAG: hypothetical protein KF802_00905 [Bdellovibrionaceae bacterium]|nr:hypothetical protein [Pseudobdellovibrionaceae bacterium]MBX3034277.1 hypothetical protein [Pseudobdellovibrionaceae bacterium]
MMKKILILLTISFGVASMTMASVDPAPPVQEFVFKFRLKGETLEVRRPATNYEEAFDKAADVCFKHFKKSLGGHLSEDQGLDVIDVCANPRS